MAAVTPANDLTEITHEISRRLTGVQDRYGLMLLRECNTATGSYPMDMTVHDLRETLPPMLRSVPSAVSSRQSTLDAPSILVRQSQTWGGVSLSEMEIRWSGSKICHEITSGEPTLWIVMEQIGGRYEYRTAPNESAQRSFPGQHTMSSGTRRDGDLGLCEQHSAFAMCQTDVRRKYDQREAG